jgi:hypothetical protein
MKSEIEHKLMSLGWWDSQRKKAESNPVLAETWADLAIRTSGIANPGAFAWTGFSSGVVPVKPKPQGWTGIRCVRGTHSCSYVRDPNGFDRLPPGYEPPVEERKAS